jgi:D-3-phosphoglycerate dehydrogenase
MYTVKTLNKIAKIGMERLDTNYFELDDGCADPDAIIVRSADMSGFAPGASLACVARAGAGYNNIPVERLATKGIVAFNTPGANANAVKEMTICALLLASRNITGSMQWLATIAGQAAMMPPFANKDEFVSNAVEGGKSTFKGPELYGKTLGLLGLGHVGAKVAKAAHDLGMTVVGYDPFVSEETAAELKGICEIVDNSDDLYPRADYISLHLPYNNDTRHTIRKDSIKKMKRGVRIVNIARGELVDDEDMEYALAMGYVGRYVTDFPNGKTITMEGAIALPHLGASTPESEDNCAIMAADQISEYMLRGNIINSVNLPNIKMERTGKYRAVVIAKDSADISVKGVAYSEKINFGYKVALIDFDDAPDEAALKAINGVIRVRVIS